MLHGGWNPHTKLYVLFLFSRSGKKSPFTMLGNTSWYFLMPPKSQHLPKIFFSLILLFQGHYDHCAYPNKRTLPPGHGREHTELTSIPFLSISPSSPPSPKFVVVPHSNPSRTHHQQPSLDRIEEVLAPAIDHCCCSTVAIPAPLAIVQKLRVAGERRIRAVVLGSWVVFRLMCIYVVLAPLLVFAPEKLLAHRHASVSWPAPWRALF